MILFIMPLGVLFYLYSSTLNDTIDFAQKERTGIAFLKPLHVLVSEIPKTSHPNAEKVDQAMQALAKLYPDLGPDMKLTESELQPRKRLDILPEKILRLYDSWKKSKNPDQACDLLSRMRVSITHIGDSSNLILDPDLDSYYLMDVILLAIPQSLYRSQALRERMGESGVISSLNAGINASMFKESDISRIVADIQTVISEDPNFYGVSPNLHANLAPLTGKFSDAGDQLIMAFEKISGGESVGNLPALLDAYDAAVDSLWVQGLSELDDLLAIRVRVYQTRLLIGWVSSLAVLLIAIGLIIFILGRMLRQITINASYIKMLGQNDLSGSIQVRSRDELGIMATELSAMSGHWTDNMRNIDTASNQLLAGSGSLERTGASMLQMSEGLAASVQEISSAIEQLNSSLATIQSIINRQMGMVEHSTLSLEEVHKSGQATLEIVRDIGEHLASSRQISHSGRESIENSFKAILAFSESLAAVVKEVRQLGTGIASVNGIVGKITDIAQQTRLLAMNASIEAAHAGPAGRGFAVVAASIQSLAAAVDASSTEIDKQLKGLETGTIQAVSNVSAIEKMSIQLSQRLDEGSQALRDMIGSIDSLSDKLKVLDETSSLQQKAEGELVGNFQQLEQLSAKVQQAVDEQSMGAHDITHGIQEIREAATAGFGTTQTVLEQSRQLSSQGQGLREIIDTYKLSKN